MRSVKSMVVLIVGSFVATFGAFASEGQGTKFEYRGVKTNVRDLSATVADGTIWEGDCADAYDKVHGDPKDHPARDRYSAALELEACIENLRAGVVSQTRDIGDPDGVRAADIFLRTAAQNNASNKDAFSAQASFMGMAFGVGVGVSFSEDEIVSEAELSPDNLVVATKTESQLPRVVFESHYYGFCHSGKCNAGVFGIGPYFAIVAKSEKLISAFSAGVMFGWRSSKPEASAGFSVGVGALLDSEVKSLASGFQAGKPLPEGETQIRFEEKSRWSALIFFTRTF